ncbi:MAG: CCA tRNA nucleotidyltransferase [Candidatus Sumerlaeaceae bacterium]
MTNLNLTSRAAAAATRVIARLKQQGYQAVLVGGCVRDLLLGREPDDFDVATSATPDQVIPLFHKSILVGASFGVVIVVQDGIHTEVATFREETGYSDRRRPDSVRYSDAEHDALRRDFTVNGLYLEPLTNEVIDYVGGQQDLQARLLRCIGQPKDRFNEDALRLIRAVRFASSLDFEIESGTWTAIQANAHLVKHVSAERVRDELMKGLTRANPARFLELLDTSGLLGIILPEVEAMKGMAQPPQFHPEGDVFEHTKLVLANLPPQPSAALAMAALLHDVGKPPTATLTDRIRFNNHHKVGAEMADSICRRLACSNELREQVMAMIERHMRFVDFPDMRTSTMRRFLSSSFIQEELELHKADCLGCFNDLDTYELATAKLAELREDEATRGALPQPYINGVDLTALGLIPGPQYKLILQRMFDEQLENRFASRDEALVYLRENLDSLRKDKP